ncbi:hypothetical protein ACSSV1_000875 [Labrenzia sp. MBR-25]
MSEAALITHLGRETDEIGDSIECGSVAIHPNFDFHDLVLEVFLRMDYAFLIRFRKSIKIEFFLSIFG